MPDLYLVSVKADVTIQSIINTGFVFSLPS